MRKGIRTFLLIAFISTVVAASYAVGLSRKEKDDMFQELELFSDVVSFIQSKYVENKTPQDLIYGSLKGLLSSLDPYSQFLSPDDYKELLVDTRGKFGGLGIEISLKDSILTVISPLEGTPAWRAGIKAGDRIVKIGNESTRGITLTEAVKKLRGTPGTKVKLTILREKENRVFDVTIKREIIKIKDIPKEALLNNTIGYVKLSEFRENTAVQLGKALSKLEKQGAKAYILDLRNNPGGLLDIAVDVASFFIGPQKLVVYTSNREGKKTEYKSLKSGKHITDVPMVVLVNGGSASASEIVSGCLQDYRRAVIVGTHTFGKACVQTIIPLFDGSALRLTTSKYYTPDGKMIQHKGIIPDIRVEQEKVEPDISVEDKAFKKAEKNASLDKEDDNFYKNDYQLVRAVDLAKGLVILSRK